MDNALNTLLGWQFVLFCLFVAGLNFILRIITEYLAKRTLFFVKIQTLWTEVILPISPVVTGAIIGAAIKMYPYPDDIKSLAGRIVFGSVAGLLSGLVYRVVRATLKTKAGDTSNSIPPGPPTVPDSPPAPPEDVTPDKHAN